MWFMLLANIPRMQAKNDLRCLQVNSGKLTLKSYNQIIRNLVLEAYLCLDQKFGIHSHFI